MSRKDIESTNHFLFQCSLFLKERQVLVNKTCDLTAQLLTKMKSLSFIHFFLVKEHNDSENPYILNATIEHVLLAERFNVFLFD